MDYHQLLALIHPDQTFPPPVPSISNIESKDLSSNSKALVKLLVIADIQALVSIKAMVLTPSISTFPSLAGPISWTKGSGL